HGVAVLQVPVGRHRQVVGIGAAGQHGGAGAGSDRGQPAGVVGVPVRGEDAHQSAGGGLGLEQLLQPGRVVGGVHEQVVAGAGVDDQVGVVVHRRDARLVHLGAGGAPDD